jgi:hypothetical protein
MMPQEIGMALLEDTVNAAGKSIQIPNGCTTLYVKIKDTSAVRGLVTVPGLHGTDQYPMDIGEEKYFRVHHQGITSFSIAGEEGTAAFKWCAVAKTSHPI